MLVIAYAALRDAVIVLARSRTNRKTIISSACSCAVETNARIASTTNRHSGVVLVGEEGIVLPSMLRFGLGKYLQTVPSYGYLVGYFLGYYRVDFCASAFRRRSYYLHA